MSTINLCLGIYGATGENGTGIPTEETYELSLKQTASFLYAHRDFPFTFFFPGLLLEWLQQNHEEFFMLGKELIARKQIEFLGGGYYNPLFPLLQPTDRVGQIELLTTALRKHLDRRPRGCWLNESAWDSSLITSCNSCGLEYVLIDHTLMAGAMETAETFPYRASISENMGKSVFVLPLNGELLKANTTPQAFLDRIIETVPHKEYSACVCAFVTLQEAAALFDAQWFDSLQQLLTKDKYSCITLALPSRVVKSETDFGKIEVRSGMTPKCSEWAKKRYAYIGGSPFAEKPSRAPKTASCVPSRPTVRDFVLLYPEILNLYSKMTYIALLISQCRGDKARKKASREELWKAQNGAAYWYIGSGGFADTAARHKMYYDLLTAEKLIRDAGKFVDAVNSFDFNMDGLSEYMAQFSQYNAYVSRRGGMIFEFDVMPCLHNFTDTVSHTLPRKMFTDYLVSEEDLELLKNGSGSPALPTFGDILYNEIKFDRVKKDVKFEVQTLFNKKQSVKLVKEFHFTKDTVRVDYRLVNTSKETIDAWFVSENSFCMQQNTADSLIIEASNDDELMNIKGNESFVSDKTIFNVRLNDTLSNCCFTLSSSDPSMLYAYPYYAQQQYVASTTGLYWHVTMLPGAVISRTISLYLKLTKKKTEAKTKKKV